MNIEPITLTVNPWLFIAICILFAAQLAIWFLCVLDYMEKPKRKKPKRKKPKRKKPKRKKRQ